MISFIKNGFHTTANCAVPSLQKPNNLSIITGILTSIHGVSGNYYLDKETGRVIRTLYHDSRIYVLVAGSGSSNGNWV